MGLTDLRVDDIVLSTGDQNSPSSVEVFSLEAFLSNPANLAKLPGAKRRNPKSAPVKPYTLPDNRLLRYEWKSTIGAGAFGRVQLVRNLNDENCYAIKIIKKSRLVQRNEVIHTNNEAAILSSFRDYKQCPFIIELSEVFQDSLNLYMVLEYVPGGELYTLLRDAGHFFEHEARFYLSEVLVAIKFLHEHQIMYRDLKPNNVLIGRGGHSKLADFGLASRSPYSDLLVGTPDYMAPEILRGEVYDHAVDLHSFGVLTYELLAGKTPYDIPGANFEDAEEQLDAIADNILAGPRCIKWPPSEIVSPLAKLLITNSMCIYPKERLGNGPGGVADIMAHAWFNNVNWTDVENGRTQPPYIPHLEGDDDASSFELQSDDDAYLFDPLRRGASERDDHGKHFEDFPYVSASSAHGRRWV